MKEPRTSYPTFSAAVEAQRKRGGGLADQLPAAPREGELSRSERRSASKALARRIVRGR